MSTKKDEKSGKKGSMPNLSEIFGEGAKTEVTAGDVFGGDLSAVRQDTRSQRAAAPSETEFGSSAKNKLNLTQLVLILNMVVLTGIVIYLIRRPAAGLTVPASASGQTTETAPPPSPPTPVVSDATDPATLIRTFDLGRRTTETLDDAISLRTAEALYAAKDYEKAAYVYERLRRNLSIRTAQDEALADWLTLQMALCLQKTQEQELLSELFFRALNSRSLVVRTLTHYNLAFIQLHNRNFLAARQQAFQALALLKSFEAYMPPTMESDLYFLTAEALTRHLLRIHNLGDDLPGALWSDAQTIHPLPITDQEQLGALLIEGIDTLSGATLGPKVEYDPLRPVGVQWSAYAMEGPLDQFLWQYASEANIALSLGSLSAVSRGHKTYLYLRQVNRNYLAEVTVGSAGLLWRFDGDMGKVYDPSAFESTENLKAILVQETISMWQRFLLRYRGDHRIPNAHYSLGQLYVLAEQSPAALGEYKLLATQYADNPLSPYALLSSSKIKTDLRDYTGAQLDLNELLIRYPNSQVMDQALLHLAEATMSNGSFKEAAELFSRVYYLNVSRQARRQSAFGLGRCAFEQEQYSEAAGWLEKALSLNIEKGDARFGPACFMLGRAYIQTQQYTKAAEILRFALDGRLANREYVQIILELAEAEIRQDQHLHAMNILESIPQERLSQDDAVEVMLARARLYRLIDVPVTAISLLRRQIEFIAESRLRAMLMLELGECYLQNGELTRARNELNEALHLLPAGGDTHRAMFLLARIAHLQDNNDQAKVLCRNLLKLNIQDEAMRHTVYNLLGAIYTAQSAYDRAALAYAGLLEQSDVQ